MRRETLRESDVTDESLFLRRREVLRLGTTAALGWSLVGCPGPGEAEETGAENADGGRPPRLSDVAPARERFRADDELSDYEDVTRYNNFYEFGTDKRDPSRRAHTLQTEPWSVVIDGEVGRPGRVPLETLLAPHALEERIYRLRCVEAWSMVVPWVGFPLGDLLARFEPSSQARHVAFETLHDPEQMPGQRRGILDWPYREGLRLDEAMHPLTILAVGLYGRALPNQNGAPLRLVVPWKYGFKSIKSIVRISLTKDEPTTSWNRQAPDEYGYYANVNPAVDHPRWSQARERRLGEFFKRPTLPFNGYGEEVAALYEGMDLRRYY